MRALPGNRRDRLRAMLADLKMPGALEAVDGILAQADSGAATAGEAIEQLLDAQIALRNNRRLNTAMRASRLPAVKTLAQFDFAFQPCIKHEQIESLHELGFLDRRENVIFLGPPGVGKTHLAISPAIAAAESGRRVYYGTLAGLIESLVDAKVAGQLSRRLRVLTYPALLVVDESATSRSARMVLCSSSNSSTPGTSAPQRCSPPTRASRNGAVCWATKSWQPPSSTVCCTTATSSTSAATATGCASTRTSCAQPTSTRERCLDGGALPTCLA